MSRTLTLEDVQAIERAIAAGTRHVEIARQMNLSLWTIARIADNRQFEPVPDAKDELLVDNAPADYVAQNLRRCPGCGAMIYLSPCVACRKAIATRPLPQVVQRMDLDEGEARS
jgi:hypothetical protein